MITEIDYNIKTENILNNIAASSKDYITNSYKSKTDILEERIDELEKEIQNLKDNFKNIYEVFFSEDLTNEK